MASSGVTVKDLLPIPDNFEMVTDPDKEEISHSLTEEPTASHALAMADHDEKGEAQEEHEDEVKDLVSCDSRVHSFLLVRRHPMSFMGSISYEDMPFNGARYMLFVAYSKLNDSEIAC